MTDRTLSDTPRGARRRSTAPSTLVALAAAALLGGCVFSGDDDGVASTRPTFIGSVASLHYDGSSDDLLTAGVGKSGLADATQAPTTSATPTAAELRRLAIYNSYRALIDMTTAGGYGVFYGPNVDASGTAGTGEGKVAGTEYITYSDDGSGTRNVTLLVQVPDSFNPAQPCIITATSSGSRGVVVHHGIAEIGEREILQLVQRLLQAHATGTDTLKQVLQLEYIHVHSMLRGCRRHTHLAPATPDIGTGRYGPSNHRTRPRLSRPWHQGGWR